MTRANRSVRRKLASSFRYFRAKEQKHAWPIARLQCGAASSLKEAAGNLLETQDVAIKSDRAIKVRDVK